MNDSLASGEDEAELDRIEEEKDAGFPELGANPG